MTLTPEIVEAFRWQAAGCAMMGSPFSTAVLLAAIEDGEALAPFVQPWATATRTGLLNDAVPLRLLGALHDLVLSGEASDLARTYPREGAPSDGAAAWRAARPLLAARADDVRAFMSHEPQTNEVGRSALLLGGFLTLAQAGLPLRCFELGASAGLNQVWDRFRYRLGEAEWGPADAAVVLAPQWSGGLPPLDAPVRVISRAACDRKPVALVDPVMRRRLQAYVWADQFERLARLRAAIDIALAAGVTVEPADAAVWTTERIAPAAGAMTVVYHSIFWQYLPPETKRALAAAIADIGARATNEAPFAWLRFEPSRDDPTVHEVRLTRWPVGGDRVLAHGQAHGAVAEWLA